MSAFELTIPGWWWPWATPAMMREGSIDCRVGSRRIASATTCGSCAGGWVTGGVVELTSRWEVVPACSVSSERSVISGGEGERSGDRGVGGIGAI